MEGLKPALLQTVEAWTQLEKDVEQFGLNTTEMRCLLRRLRAPFFSLEQAESHTALLQVSSSFFFIAFNLQGSLSTSAEVTQVLVENTSVQENKFFFFNFLFAASPKESKERKRVLVRCGKITPESGDGSTLSNCPGTE